MITEIAKQYWILPVSTPDGEFLAHYSTNGLCGLDFPPNERPHKARTNANEIPSQIRAWHEATKRAVARVLIGQLSEKLPPLDLSCGTDFQQRVWQALLQIAPGHTLSYAQVAEAIGKPKAVRAVGGACGANPVPVLVPCHRVLAANSHLGGFSSGLDWKRRLLAREGIQFKD